MLWREGKSNMSKKKQAVGWTPQKQKHYERVARLQYGAEIVNESVQRWNSYTKAEQAAIQQEGGEVYADLAKALEAGTPSHDSEVQAILERWHQHLRYFYEPTLDILRGLGEGYRSEPGFIAFFQKFHAELPEYLCEAITKYVDDLEYAEIERMLAEDDLTAKASRLSMKQ
jgi:MerR family transcriptional regulator, thiopeptide resistance regulator